MANLVRSQQRDVALLQAIAGVDNPKDGNITIIEDYFANERMINRRESGYEVPEDYQPTQRCHYETRVWRNDKMMEDVEQGRTARKMEWDIHEPDLEDYQPQPPTETAEIV